MNATNTAGAEAPNGAGAADFLDRLRTLNTGRLEAYGCGINDRNTLEWSAELCIHAALVTDQDRQIRQLHEAASVNGPVLGRLRAALAERLGELVGMADLVAMRQGIDLRPAVADALNRWCERRGLQHRLSVDAPPATELMPRATDDTAAVMIARRALEALYAWRERHFTITDEGPQPRSVMEPAPAPSPADLVAALAIIDTLALTVDALRANLDGYAETLLAKLCNENPRAEPVVSIGPGGRGHELSRELHADPTSGELVRTPGERPS